MSKFIKSFLWIIWLFILIGCGQQAKKERPSFEEIVDDKEAEPMAKAIITSQVLRREYLNQAGDIVLFLAEFFYPQIENTSNQKAIDQVNQEIKTKAEKDFEAAFREGSAYAKNFYEGVQKTGEESSRFPLVAEQSYRIALNQDNVLSVVVQNYKDFGGAHPETLQSAYTYDLTTGKQKTAGDILQLSEQEAKGYVAQSFYTIVYEEPENFFSDALDTLSNGKFEYGFFLEGDAIIFFLNPYVIAPYAAGVQTVHLLINPQKKP